MTSPDLTKVPLAQPVTLQNEIALLKSSLGVNPKVTMSAPGLQSQLTNFLNITPQCGQYNSSFTPSSSSPERTILSLEFEPQSGNTVYSAFGVNNVAAVRTVCFGYSIPGLLLVRLFCAFLPLSQRNNQSSIFTESFHVQYLLS